MMEKLLTIDEASQVLGISVKTIYTYVCKKIIPHVKIQGNLRFRESDLEAWVEKQLVKPLNE